MPQWKARYKKPFDLRKTFQRVVDVDANNNPTEVHWINKQGLYHRIHGPAYTLIDENQNFNEEWFQNGLSHRPDGPAKLRWSDKTRSRLLWEGWYQDGYISREDGPAETAYYSNGVVRRFSWRLRGMFHRIDGPADVLFLRDGREIERSYWVENKLKGAEVLIDISKPTSRP